VYLEPPLKLDYGNLNPTPRRNGVGVAFWCMYIGFGFVGFCVLGPVLDGVFFGHPGDQSVTEICLKSIAIVSLIVLVLYIFWLRRTRPAVRLTVAAVTGFTAILPPYVWWAIMRI
jgi:hypothetical protein